MTLDLEVVQQGVDKNFNVPPKKEEEVRVGKGVLLLVVALRPNGEPLSPYIWTIVEKERKDSTEKYPGQTSIPAETSKDNEDLISNLMGALGEFNGDEEVIRGLQYVPGNDIVPNAVNLNGIPLDIALVFYNGPTDLSPSPIDDFEVSPQGWRSRAQLRAEQSQTLQIGENGSAVNVPKVRSILGLVLDFDERTGFIRGAIEGLQRGEGRPLHERFPSGYTNLRSFVQRRNASSDTQLPRISTGQAS